MVVAARKGAPERDGLQGFDETESESVCARAAGWGGGVGGEVELFRIGVEFLVIWG
jgi:hypothetical protein